MSSKRAIQSIDKNIDSTNSNDFKQPVKQPGGLLKQENEEDFDDFLLSLETSSPNIKFSDSLKQSLGITKYGSWSSESSLENVKVRGQVGGYSSAGSSEYLSYTSDDSKEIRRSKYPSTCSDGMISDDILLENQLSVKHSSSSDLANEKKIAKPSPLTQLANQESYKQPSLAQLANQESSEKPSLTMQVNHESSKQPSLAQLANQGSASKHPSLTELAKLTNKSALANQNIGAKTCLSQLANQNLETKTSLSQLPNQKVCTKDAHLQINSTVSDIQDKISKIDMNDAPKSLVTSNKGPEVYQSSQQSSLASLANKQPSQQSSLVDLANNRASQQSSMNQLSLADLAKVHASNSQTPLLAPSKHLSLSDLVSKPQAMKQPSLADLAKASNIPGHKAINSSEKQNIGKETKNQALSDKEEIGSRDGSCQLTNDLQRLKVSDTNISLIDLNVSKMTKANKTCKKTLDKKHQEKINVQLSKTESHDVAPEITTCIIDFTDDIRSDLLNPQASVVGQVICFSNKSYQISKKKRKHPTFSYHYQMQHVKTKECIHHSIVPFDFSTPSPDDIVKSKQKAAFTRK